MHFVYKKSKVNFWPEKTMAFYREMQSLDTGKACDLLVNNRIQCEVV